jgi:hypothetical protein
MYTQQEIEQFEWHIAQHSFHHEKYKAMRNAGIDWRTKEARFQLTEKRFHAWKVPLTYIVNKTFKKHAKDIARNVTQYNSLVRLMAKNG